ncbi:endonuclease 8-like 3 isoform X1 [Colossoma macropomum]|uniref:endonuclease 8-like 3 isoform X1 n=1 Tax=Colossoma macropomum TaxID=42526 RepID=UPI001864540F|nr:endonuclease 8-like 3 isoform X1 [Colossoma macropomum]
MVEGPGCTLNGERIRAKVQKGQKVVKVSGASAARNDGVGPSVQCITGCTYTGVQTLGKELFMYFGPRALRLHFGMNGSMRINLAEMRDGRGHSPTFLIHLTKDTICFFDSTVEIRLSEDCEEKVRVKASLDVCSPIFSVSRAVEAVCMESGRMLCDVLLDQAVLPGVGNIIKNEALFNSGLNPAVKVNQLTNEQVKHLVKMTRDFTILFYQCRKRGSSLNQHYKVYRRSNCGQCSGTITLCRLGDNNRMTYFCQRCQTEDPTELDISKLPSMNTLLEWTSQEDESSSDHVATREEEEWTCDLCTLINRPVSKSCEACLSPRPEISRDAAQRPQLPSALIRYPCNSFSSPQPDLKLNRRAAFGHTTLILTDLNRKPAAALKNPPAGTQLELQNSRRSAGIGTQPIQTSPGSPSQPSKRRKTEGGHLPGGDNQRSSGSGTQNQLPSSPTTPCCATHRRSTVLRVVNKAGANKGRQFYTCSLPRGSQCDFFEWADLHFPLCHHAKRTLMRTVLKLGPNNGRNFYTCPLKQGQQCDFFQWV